MDKITQDMRFRRFLLNYAKKYGVTKAAIKYKINQRYDGTWESLKDKSYRHVITRTGTHQ